MLNTAVENDIFHEGSGSGICIFNAWGTFQCDGLLNLAIKKFVENDSFLTWTISMLKIPVCAVENFMLSENKIKYPYTAKSND